MDETPTGYQNGQNVRNPNSRPSSIYDNYGNNGQTEELKTMTYETDEIKKYSCDPIVDNNCDRSPTQEFLLKTTVPQNLAATNLAGRHTPTRNSLRHSRMIVLSRTGNVPRSYLPPVIRHRCLATALVALQALLGATVCCLSAWLLVWTPNLRKRDNPYWSGLPLLASGTLGLLFLCSCRREHPGTFKGYCITGTKIFSIFLSIVAAAATLIASIFGLIHIITLTAMTCETKIQLNDTCFCYLGTNSTTSLKTYHYADLKCTDVDQLFTILLIVSIVVNILGGILCLWYIYLHCSTKYSYAYSKVRTKENNTKVPRCQKRH